MILRTKKGKEFCLAFTMRALKDFIDSVDSLNTLSDLLAKVDSLSKVSSTEGSDSVLGLLFDLEDYVKLFAFSANEGCRKTPAKGQEVITIDEAWDYISDFPSGVITKLMTGLIQSTIAFFAAPSAADPQPASGDDEKKIQ